MRLPKTYGSYREDSCPFCDKRATTQNSQGLPVCLDHKHAVLNDFKCACGKYLELRKGKFGVFFNCLKCGNYSMKKALEFNEIKDISKDAKKQELREKREKLNEAVTSKSESKKPDFSDEFILSDGQSSHGIEKREPAKPFENEFIIGEPEIVRSDDPRYFD